MTISCRLLVFAFLVQIPGVSLHAQDFKSSIVATDFDFITDDDPSTFQSLKFVGKEKAEMPDKRKRGELFQDTFKFVASFRDNTEVAIFVAEKGKDQPTAKAEALRYVHPLGKLPTALRRGVNRLCVHEGGKTTTAFSDVGLIIIYSDNATVRISNHDLEETIFHESVHAAWDAEHARSEAWKRAQQKDGNFATLYARSKPEREDLAESALFAYTILHHPERLPAPVRKSLREKVSNRILFIEKLLPVGKPIHFDARSIKQSAVRPPDDDSRACNLRFRGKAEDIIRHSLVVDFGIDERRMEKLFVDVEHRFADSEELFVHVVRTANVDPAKLKKSILVHLHENCSHDLHAGDAEIKALVESWGPPKRSTAEKMSDLKRELRKKWPKNRTVRFVFHGHSVPAGYFKTPNIQRFDSYPTLFHRQLCELYSTAAIDVCVTAIGGENSISGAKRFSNDVLNLKPDVVFIDYGLNDRRGGLQQSRDAWQAMVQQCLRRDILVVLLTPTPDSNEDITDNASPLALHAAQIRELGAEYKVSVVDSYAAFQKRVSQGQDVGEFLSQANHPNRAGHEVVASLLTKLFRDVE